MSSGSASAITALIAPAAALPEVSMAPVAADASVPSAFSRLLDAEAQLAQTVSQLTQSAAPLPGLVAPGPAASNTVPELAVPLDLANDTAPSSMIAVESHVALALAQAAHAGLSQAEHAQQEPEQCPVRCDVNAVDAGLGIDLEAAETASPPSAPVDDEATSTRSTGAKVARFSAEESDVVVPLTTAQGDEEVTDSAAATSEQEVAAPARLDSRMSRPANVEAKPYSPEISAEETAAHVPKTRTAVTEVPPSDAKTLMAVRVTPHSAPRSVPTPEPASKSAVPAPKVAAPTTDSKPVRTAQSSISPSRNVVQTERDVDVQPLVRVDTANVNALLQAQDAPSSSSTVSAMGAVAGVLPLIVPESEQPVRVFTSEEDPVPSVQTVLPAEVFVGAAGVLNAMFTPATPAAPIISTTTDDATSMAFASNAISEELGSGAHPEVMKREAVVRMQMRPIALPNHSAFELGNEVDAGVGRAAEVEGFATTEPHAVSTPTRSVQFVFPRVIETLPAEVRVISSQVQREVQRELEVEEHTVEREFQAKATSLRTEALDGKSEQSTGRAQSLTVTAAPITDAKKVAWKSSPEGFSSDAQQSEVSASAVTVPFPSGGRSETIASRNSAPAPTLSEAPRPDRVLTQTLEAIPNPLRVTTFEIRPEGHGPIRVRISARGEGENTVWRVQIQTSDSAARSLLNDHMNELRERLPAENVVVELGGAAADVRTEAPQREAGGSWRERGGEHRQSRGEEQQRQPKQQKGSDFLEWLAAQK